MTELTTIEDVATAAGVPTARLRRWCATGQLRCDRDERGWLVPQSEIARVDALVASRGHGGNGHHPVALAMPVDRDFGDGLVELTRRAEVTPEVAGVPLSVDGMDYAIVSWPSIGDDGRADAVAELAWALDAEILCDAT